MNCFSFAARYLKAQVEGVGAAVKVQLDFRALLTAVHFDNAAFQAFERPLVYNNAFVFIKMNHRSPDFRPKPQKMLDDGKTGCSSLSHFPPRGHLNNVILHCG